MLSYRPILFSSLVDSVRLFTAVFILLKFRFGFIQELCNKGGILFLARAILKLNVVPPFVESSRVVAAVSRLKAKVLSIVSVSDEDVLLISTLRL